MIRDVEAWRRWEDAYISATPADYEQNVRIAEALLNHARQMGVFPPKNPLEGIEDKITFARALNVRFNSSRPR